MRLYDAHPYMADTRRPVRRRRVQPTKCPLTASREDTGASCLYESGIQALKYVGPPALPGVRYSRDKMTCGARWVVRALLAGVAVVGAALAATVLASPARAGAERSYDYAHTCATVARLAGISPSQGKCDDPTLSVSGFSSLRVPVAWGLTVKVDYGIFRDSADAHRKVGLGSQQFVRRIAARITGLPFSALYIGQTARCGLPAKYLTLTEALFAVGRVFVDVVVHPDGSKTTGTCKPNIPLVIKLAHQLAAPLPRG